MSMPRYIPLDASETAFLPDSQSLLPLTVYQQLATFIHEAVKKVPDFGTSPDINAGRSHNAVSVDGTRGTGKTAVLVNLRKYLESDEEHRKLLADIHILTPIDPTLLEENESLFLHIIVAALLSDKEVQRAQNSHSIKDQALNKSLEQLANALASVEKQNSDYGMAKLRALFGNQRLAACVQDFFKATLDLLGKKLLVLPIDDVDTSLNRAFENLEIIRRYLTTPFVLPIVSGDRALYREVTWRDFHGRMTKDSKFRADEAYTQALELADEYQRKLLPLPRRLEMPDIHKYLQDREIILGDAGDVHREKSMPLNNFYSWLQIFISGPVNGLEGSELELPVPSIRALTQLVKKCGSLIPGLPTVFRQAKSAQQVQRAWQMPEVSHDAIEAFEREYHTQAAEKRDYPLAYKIFAEQQGHSPVTDCARMADDDLLAWEKMLYDYFRYEGKAGAVTLVLLASQHWQPFREGESTGRITSVFATPLFQPLLHEDREFALFDKFADLEEWVERLDKRLPESWLTRLHSRQTILPYPVPEVGINSSTGWRYWNDLPTELKDTPGGSRIVCLASLSLHHNFYTASKQSFMVNIGRIFEVIIASLVGDVSTGDLQRIAQNAPFFSAGALAPSKTLNTEVVVDDEAKKTTDRVFPTFGFNVITSQTGSAFFNRPSSISESIDQQLIELQKEINQWRASHDLHLVRFSPWMIYKVFNKVYSQFANSDYLPNGFKELSKVIDTVGLAFYSIWSAFGSFEKGTLFGLPDVIATVNLHSPKNFDRSNDHFNTNLGPFAPRRGQNDPDKTLYGKSTRTASYCLADHPLRSWMEGARRALSPQPTISLNLAPEADESKIIEDEEIPGDPRVWLRKRLDFKPTARLTEKAIWTALDKFTPDTWDEILREMREHYPKRRLTTLLEGIIEQKKAER